MASDLTAAAFGASHCIWDSGSLMVGKASSGLPRLCLQELSSACFHTGLPDASHAARQCVHTRHSRTLRISTGVLHV